MDMHPSSARSYTLGSRQKPNVDSRLRTHLAKAILALATASGLMAGLPGQAAASVITYDYKTTLVYGFGAPPDAEGLAGATIELKVDIDADAKYFVGYGAQVSMNNDATVTISGASLGANNATYALGQLNFLAGPAGMYMVGNANPSVSLADGSYLNMNFRQGPTSHGSHVQPGDLIDMLDFAPATPRLQNWSAGGTSYRQTNVSITASLQSTSADSPPSSAAVPEPASIALFGIGSVAALGAARRRRTA